MTVQFRCAHVGAANNCSHCCLCRFSFVRVIVLQSQFSACNLTCLGFLEMFGLLSRRRLQFKTFLKKPKQVQLQRSVVTISTVGKRATEGYLKRPSLLFTIGPCTSTLAHLTIFVILCFSFFVDEQSNTHSYVVTIEVTLDLVN